MTGVKSALLVPLFLSFSFSRVQASSFKLHSTHNIFCFATTLGFLELYIKKKSVFFIFVAKTRWNQLYSIKSIFWFVCRKIVSLPALLHLEKVFFQSAAGHPGFLLHFTKNNVFTCVWLGDAIWNPLSENNLYLCFRNQTALLMLYITRKMFWFVTN